MARQQDIKRAQRESYFFREIAQLFMRIMQDEPRLSSLFITKVTLSSDGGTCVVLFLSHKNREDFDEKLPILVLYKPSIRAALAKMSHGRYTPNLSFRYDEGHEKTERINLLIDSLKREGRL
jgi:ribosome-binding factor A